MTTAGVEGASVAPPQRGRPRWLAPALSLVAGGAACAVVALTGDLPLPDCILKATTGIDCPLCGGTRAVRSLLGGDLVAAAGFNLAVLVALPVLAWAWLAWAAPRAGLRPLPRIRPPAWAVPAAWVLVAVFSVARNLPGPLSALGT